MKNLQRSWLVLLTLSVVVEIGFAEESDIPEDQKIRRRWVTRVNSELSKVVEEERDSAALRVVIAVAESRDFELAKSLTKQISTHRDQVAARMAIASIQSNYDQLKEALATAREVEPGYGRQVIYSMIALRQAQRGEVEDAISILKEITNATVRDRTLGWIAKAQAIAGNIPAAQATVDSMANEERRAEIRKQIKTAKADPAREIPSRFLREQIGTMLAFSGTERQREAIQAIIAAQRNDQAALNRHIEAALSEQGIPLELATTRTILAVALAEAGRREEAREMILAARKANESEWLGASDIFGSPVLVHLLIRLGFEEDLNSLMKSLETEDSSFKLGYHVNLQAVGATYTYLSRLDDAEKYYRRIKTPLERVHFAAGVLRGLRADKSARGEDVKK